MTPYGPPECAYTHLPPLDRNGYPIDPPRYRRSDTPGDAQAYAAAQWDEAVRLVLNSAEWEMIAHDFYPWLAQVDPRARAWVGANRPSSPIVAARRFAAAARTFREAARSLPIV